MDYIHLPHKTRAPHTDQTRKSAYTHARVSV